MGQKPLKEILNLCTRCGKCVPFCPSYKIFKKEAFSPRGRLFLVSQNKIHKSFDFCLLCEKCERICPHGIGFSLFYFKNLKQKKDLTESFSFLNTEKKEIHFYESKKSQLIVYPSCGVKYLYPEAVEKFIFIMKKRDISVEVPREFLCCGAPFLNLGIPSLLKETAIKNLNILEKIDKPFAIFCATCFWIIKKVYPLIFEGTSYEERFLRVSQKMFLAYQILFEIADKEMKDLQLKSKSEKILFHLPCHLTEEFKLLKNKIDTKEFCCGSPKLFLWTKGFQEKYKKEWIKNLENIDILATFCTGCYLNFNMLLKKPPLIYHWLELL